MHRIRYMAGRMVHHTGKPQEEEPRLARRRNGEEAKGQPPHMGRAILILLTGLQNDLSQNIIGNDRNTTIRSSKIKQLFVSKRSKFENWLSLTVPAIR